MLDALRSFRSVLHDEDASELRFDEVELAAQDIGVTARRVGSIVADLRLFGRTSERVDACADVRRVLGWALRMSAHELRDRAKVHTELESARFAAIDEARLGQVLLHLLINAAHSITKGNPNDNVVSVRATSTPAGKAIIEVADTGSGISPAVMRRLFEPFFTTKDVGAGTGLGLSISHAIVTAAGGTIEVEPRASGGTVLRVVLPEARGAKADRAL